MKDNYPSTIAAAQKKSTREEKESKRTTSIPDDIARNTYTRDRPIGLHVQVLRDKQKAS